MRALLALALLVALPLPAQSVRAYRGDTLNMTPQLSAVLEATPPHETAAFCAPAYRRRGGNLWVDSLEVAPLAANPDCDPRAAVVLVRPVCAFTVAEFIGLRYRALYVLLICRPNAVGFSLGNLERST